MRFVKLDCGILTSTLWVDPIERDLFITALLMARPCEFPTPQPQIDVMEIRETGFVAPPGWYGMVDAAGVGIIRQALVPEEEGRQALVRLGSPDPESRSRAHEGRRLIRINGGYVVLNYMEYLLKDYGAAERMRRYRQKIRNNIVTPVTVTNTDVTRTVTYGEGEGEGYKNKIAPTGAEVSLAERKERPQDKLWEAMIEVCGLDGGTPTDRERKAWNGAVKSLRSAGATPGEVRARARCYRTRWPNMSLTPTALARRWTECVAEFSS